MVLKNRRLSEFKSILSCADFVPVSVLYKNSGMKSIPKPQLLEEVYTSWQKLSSEEYKEVILPYPSLQMLVSSFIKSLL